MLQSLCPIADWAQISSLPQVGDFFVDFDVTFVYLMLSIMLQHFREISMVDHELKECISLGILGSTFPIPPKIGFLW